MDTVAKLGAVSIAMFAFVFVVMVPLYNVLCDALGINGKTSSEAYISVVSEVDETRSIKVQFIATNNDGMPWAFAPDVTEMPMVVSAPLSRWAREPLASLKACATCVSGSSIRPTETISTTDSIIPGSREKNQTMKPVKVATMTRIEQQQMAARRSERVAMRMMTKPTKASAPMHAFA